MPALCAPPMSLQRARSARIVMVLACSIAALVHPARAASPTPAPQAPTVAPEIPPGNHSPSIVKRVQIGMASVYARMLHGHRTASGEPHDSTDLTAAHRTLPLGTQVRVTNLANNESVVVRINDRGPNVRNRIIDLSPAAAADIGLRARGQGITRVRIDVLDEPSA